ncbi:MAG: hypothetical protein RBS87_07295 [Acholeplasma sp.]|jgi:hypothetical protein|nr:hypothetical protein [Acholeplasma sp.]
MYKTIVIDRIKKAHERAVKLEEVIKQQEAEGWDYINAIGTAKQETILVFQQNPTAKLNKDINKGIQEVKGKLNNIVDAIKK